MLQHKLDTYLNLCTQVYDLSKPNAPEDAYDFYKSYAIKAKGPILEPMCGTGRFLLPMLAEGFDAHGFDASPHMLDALRTKAKKLNLQPKVWQGFVEDLQQPDPYSLIFIPGGSFGLILDIEKAKAALKTFYNHLTDEGTLAFEIETMSSSPKVTGVWQSSTWPLQDGQSIVASFMALPTTGTICSTTCKYELTQGSQTLQSEVEDFKLRLYSAEQISDMLKETGFKKIRMVKAFDQNGFAEADDEVIVFECRK